MRCFLFAVAVRVGVAGRGWQAEALRLGQRVRPGRGWKHLPGSPDPWNQNHPRGRSVAQSTRHVLEGFSQRRGWPGGGRTRGRAVWAKGRVWPLPRAERPVPRRGAARGSQRLGQLRRAVSLQGQDVRPAAGHLPGHRGQNPGRGPQPGHGLLGEPPAAAPRPHGTGQVSTARPCRDRGPGGAWGARPPAASAPDSRGQQTPRRP